MNNQLNKVNQYYSKKKSIRKIVLKNVGKDEIIYGQSALNRQLPKKLRVHTEDYDIFAKNPREEAKQLEKALDKHFSGNYFTTKPAIHKGTFKVISKIDGKTYADYTLLKKKTPYKIINGKKYVTLEYIKRDKIKILKDPEAKFRHAKEKDALNRLLLAERLKRQRKRIARRPAPRPQARFGLMRL